MKHLGTILCIQDEIPMEYIELGQSAKYSKPKASDFEFEISMTAEAKEAVKDRIMKNRQRFLDEPVRV